MTKSNDWEKSLLQITVLPIIFFLFAFGTPVLTVEDIPRPEPYPGGHLHPTSFFLIGENSFLSSSFGVDVPFVALWTLLGLMLLQMVLPNYKKVDLFIDIGLNLLISAGVLWMWTTVLYPMFILLEIWGSQMVIQTPVLALILVPVQRTLAHHYRKRKNDDASETNSEASH